MAPSGPYPPDQRRHLGFDAPFEEADRLRSTEDARNQFLSAVQRTAPEVLEDLAGEPLQLDRALPSRIHGQPATLSICQRNNLLSSPSAARSLRDAAPEFFACERLYVAASRAVEASIFEWAVKWFYDPTEWLLDRARLTLACWSDVALYRRIGASDDRHLIGSSWAGARLELAAAPLAGLSGPERLILDGWDLRFEAKVQVRNRLHEAISDHLDELEPEAAPLLN